VTRRRPPFSPHVLADPFVVVEAHDSAGRVVLLERVDVAVGVPNDEVIVVGHHGVLDRALARLEEG
jgi:hypothetical protein